jgi:HSP20 family protein
MPPKGEKEDFEFDFGLGKVKLGNIFENLGKLVDFAEKLKEAGDEIKKEGEFTLPGKKEVKGVYGFSVRMGLDRNGVSRPVVEPFGNIKKTPKGAVVDEVREPLVDVFDEPDGIHIVAEMPGIDDGEIDCEVKGDVVILNGGKRYSKEIVLSAPVDTEPLERNYKNGVFELKLKKKVS